MGTHKINVLLAEDNLDMCDVLKNYFQLTNDIAVCGITHDGEDALLQIRQCLPDVVLLDLVMPKMDGISVLEELQANPLKKQPLLLVASAIGQEKITAKALELGASYYMIKPYVLEDLHRRILLLAEDLKPESPGRRRLSEHDDTPLISKEVMSLGVPTNLLGYQYMVSALRIIMGQNRPCPIAKQVYATIADENNTTLECVESAIRKTINRIYQVHNDNFCSVMQLDVTGQNKKPSNGRFLTLLAEKIKLQKSLMQERAKL